MTSSRVISEPAGATPAMRQYFDAKRQHRDAIVFFRMGDFYEMFYEDALTAARALELTLTSRSKDASGGAIPMCGVPYHAADGYIARLVRKGFRVAICEQVEDPKKAKGLVRREVVRVVSPGHADRRRLPRGARAGVPDGASRRPPPAPGYGVGAARSLDRRVHGRRVSRRRMRGRRSPTSSRSCGRARSSRPPASTSAAALVETLRARARGRPRSSGWTFDAEVGAARAARAAADAEPRRVRPRGARRPRVSAAGALVHYLRDTQKADLAHVRDDRVPHRRRLPARSIRPRCGTSR